MKSYKNYVNNEWVGGAGIRDVFNPATGEPFILETNAVVEGLELADKQ